jgi:hypothetical protein
MMSIMTISELQAWKHQHIHSDSLSLIELARRGLKAEEALAEAREINNAPLGVHCGDAKLGSIHVITNIFACAASIYLHVVVSGACPEIPEIRRGVADTIEALISISDAGFVKSLTWPICIAACLAEGDARLFFERLEQGISDEYGKNQKVLRGLSTARECWRLRDRKESSGARNTSDWIAGMASLGEMILLF